MKSLKYPLCAFRCTAELSKGFIVQNKSVGIICSSKKLFKREGINIFLFHDVAPWNVLASVHTSLMRIPHCSLAWYLLTSGALVASLVSYASEKGLGMSHPQTLCKKIPDSTGSRNLVDMTSF